MLQTLSDVVGTRLSRSFGVPNADAAAPCLLIRIYPVNGIEQPLELGHAPVLVGRDAQCTLPLCDDSVSRRHAMIEPHASGHLVSDLGSMNGTFVNDEQLSGARRLHAGDRVRFGNQIFKYLGGDRIEAQYHEVIFNLMTTDGLTGAHNRRYLIDTLEREIVQSRRAQSSLCVLLLDLDRFKSVNDTFGHLAGDAVLVEFARRVTGALRSGDLFARYGGEEFALVLTRTGVAEAAEIAERVRQITAAAPVEFDGVPISVTVSIGLCCQPGGTACTALELLARADEQLYRAKSAGRNQVCCSDPAPAAPP